MSPPSSASPATHKVPEIIGQRMELKTHGIGGEGTARQPRPFDRALSFLDPLLARAAPVIKGDDTLGRSRQVGDDEPHTRIHLARMPLDLRHNMAWLVPALRLIAEAGVK